MHRLFLQFPLLTQLRNRIIHFLVAAGRTVIAKCGVGTPVVGEFCEISTRGQKVTRSENSPGDYRKRY